MAQAFIRDGDFQTESLPAKPSSTASMGDFGEDCLRVPFFFGYFLLGKQKKVTCRRATPGLPKKPK
jgi:hypothetical protein